MCHFISYNNGKARCVVVLVPFWEQSALESLDVDWKTFLAELLLVRNKYFFLELSYDPVLIKFVSWLEITLDHASLVMQYLIVA